MRILSLVLVGLLILTGDFGFTDVTDEAGLSDFVHIGGTPRKRYIYETTGSGVGFIDYDRDGWVDIYLVNGADREMMKNGSAPGNRLYRNNGNGTFTDVTKRAGVAGNGLLGQGIAVGDYNNDGWDDIYVTNFGPNILYRNNGDGTFTDVTKRAGCDDPRWSTGAAFGDYDADGDLDLMVVNYVELDLDNLPEPGGGGKVPASYCTYRGVPVMCGPRGLKGASDTLYRNNGDGTFTDVSKQAGVDDSKLLYGFQPTWIDVDSDGDLDLFISNDSVGNYLYRNDGRGKFTDVSYSSGVAVNEEGRQQACMGVAWGDYDRDGDFDLYLTNFSDDTNTLYQNEGDGNFLDQTFQAGHGQPTIPYLGWGTFFFDYDNDADLDLFVANGHVYPEVDKHEAGTSYRQRCLLFANEKGKFAEIGLRVSLTQKRSFRGAAVADIDNDGDLDIVVNAMDERPLLLRNDAAKGNFLSVKLVGTKSNRSAIGARVRVRTGELWQQAFVASGSSYLSQNDLRLHFGLGQATKVDELEVIWPSGARTRLNNVKVNQFLTLKE
ncbi:MAG: CRTAC1 family protein [Acidobacteriota bacterium]|nr:CRTAC1 family protein [Blastocatellia bacterium]MDW8413126.1 CRTAC1 family protein [Acidobacteriota bacterium]